MKTPSRVSAVVALLVLFASAIPAVVSARENPVLNRGMTGEAVIGLVGKPDEISKIKSDEFEAETWIYRRKLEQTVYQTANQQTFIPAMVGFDSGGMVIGKAVVPDYRLKYAAAYQMTALLMVNGKLYLGRQWVARSEDYVD